MHRKGRQFLPRCPLDDCVSSKVSSSFSFLLMISSQASIISIQVRARESRVCSGCFRYASGHAMVQSGIEPPQNKNVGFAGPRMVVGAVLVEPVSNENSL